MDLRPRLTDTFALLGILLLLATVPSYVAQDEFEEDLSAGWQGTFPKPRDGARMEIEMVATWKGEEPIVVGPVWTHSVRAVTPGEVPVDAAFVYERVRHPMHVDLGWGSYRVDHDVERLYFDASGAFVWENDVVVDRAEDASEPDMLKVGDRRILGESTDLNEWAGVPIQYHPSLARLAFMDAARNIPVEFGNQFFDRDDPNHHAVADATLHRGMTLYRLGLNPFDRLLEGLGPCAGCISHPPETIGLKLDEDRAPADWNGNDMYGWIHPDWPIPVGPHMWYYDKAAGEVFLEIAFVPRMLEPGDGRAFDVRWQPRGSHDLAFSNPGTEDPPLGTMRLGDLPSDLRPLHKGVSAADLTTLLREAGHTGRLVEFYWVDHAPETREQETAALLPFAPPEGATDPLTVEPMTWFVTVAQGDGDIEVVALRIERSGDGTRLVEASAACAGHAMAKWALSVVSCEPVEPSMVAADRVVGDPLAALQAAAQQADVAAQDLPAFAYLPLYHQTVEDSRHGYRSVQERWAIYPADARLPYSYWGTPDRAVAGAATWRTNQTDGHTTGSLDLHDGGPYSRASFRTATPMETAPQSAVVGAVRAPGALTPLEVVGATAMTGGLLLVLLSLAARSLGWFKAGGALPLFAALYAKIARSDVLLHDRRGEIMELVRADPGVTASDIARTTGYGWGATVHHLETLVRSGHLSAVAMHGRRHYFTLEEGSHASRKRDAARRDRAAAEFLDAVAAQPGATLKELAGLLDRRASGLSRTGARLTREGLLRKQRDGMNVRFWPAGPVQMAQTASAPDEDVMAGTPS